MAIRHKTNLFLAVSLLVALVQIFFQPGLTLAISDQQKQLINQGIYFYDVDSSTNCSITSSIDNPPGEGGSVSLGGTATDTLPSDLAAQIKQNQPIYEQAAQATNVPWQLLAAIHFRESGLSLNAADAGPNGQYQITTKNYPFSGTLTQAQFLQESIDAGNFLQSKVSANLPGHQKPLTQTNNDPDEIKDTMYSYNSRAAAAAQQAASLGFNPATQPYEGSSYVMNDYDAVHKNMQIVLNSQLAGLDARLGAFVIYSALLGYSPGADCSSAPSSTSLAAGNDQQLSQQILSNSNISFDFGPNGEVAQPFKDMAAGNLASNNNGCPAAQVSTHILQEILLLAQSHKVNVSALTTDHPCGNVHTVGRAVDINILDGNHIGSSNSKNDPANYDTALANTLMRDALPALPPGSGFGDCDGHKIATNGLSGVNFFIDYCNHVHTQVPPGS